MNDISMEEFESLLHLWYKVYKELWEAATGEGLICERSSTMFKIDMLMNKSGTIDHTTKKQLILKVEKIMN